MVLLEVVFTLLFGLAFGSFLNVCIVRLPRDESIVRPGSRCASCLAPIGAKDNIPLISWMLLRGRSRCCGQLISLRYPLVEAATALLFLACLLQFGVNVTGVGMAVFCWLLLGLAWMDAETYLLPDAFTLPGIAVGMAYQGFIGDAHVWAALLSSLLGAVIVGGLLFLVALLYKLIRRREGMGFGDVKLGAMLGAWLGWQLAGVALFLAVIGGALAGIYLLIKRSLSAKTTQNEPMKGPLRLPFGSFLASAGIAAVFVGARLLADYLKLFP